jgi:hypothetical protein
MERRCEMRKLGEEETVDWVLYLSSDFYVGLVDEGVL